MIPNKNTQIMARLHRTDNDRGINIYNPYFEETGVNALYVLFHNPDPKPLVQGLKNLNMAGTISAGFESDPQMVELVDELGPISQTIGKIGTIRQRDGKTVGDYLAGSGLADSIDNVTAINDKSVVILGAGQVVEALLKTWEMRGVTPRSVSLYNRTLSKAERLATKYQVVKQVKPLDELSQSQADLFINATDIGNPWDPQPDDMFNEALISGYDYIVDVTFVPLEPKLIKLANALGKKNAPGWQMFVHQGKASLEMILDIEVQTDVLQKYVRKDFETNWT